MYQQDIHIRFQKVRAHTLFLCEPLETEDYIAQPIVEVSPIKWNLGHTTWFFEQFVLIPHLKNYTPLHKQYAMLFNSYYISAGQRWKRADRGQLTRPTLQEVLQYRSYVEDAMEVLMANPIPQSVVELILLGTHHEQQHQELLLSDIKWILGSNPLAPVYRKPEKLASFEPYPLEWLSVKEDTYSIGFEGSGFHFDNEKEHHKVFLHEYKIASRLVTNGEYMDFIQDGGYRDFRLWLSDGWDWVCKEKINYPAYWKFHDGEWMHYTLGGISKVIADDPISHISFYEADAFAKWRNLRLPTEQEWEVACMLFDKNITNSQNFVEKKYFMPVQTQNRDFLGNLWEWTASPYVPYPKYQAVEGAIGEYNGKFMVNQIVLRGGSYATPANHIRPTYRNFFHPQLRWLFGGIRLAKYI